MISNDTARYRTEAADCIWNRLKAYAIEWQHKKSSDIALVWFG